LDTHTPSALANKLLAGLPHADSEALRTHFTVVPLAQGTVLFEVDEEVDQVFFPLSGMISLLVILKNGDAIETATVGREGVVGAMAGLGLHTSRVRAVSQLAGYVARLPAVQLRKAAAASAAISNLCIRYNELLLAQARITAACNISHPVEARFCRWLLQSRDRAESDTVPLTQEFLSEMLGVRRTSVTEVAIKMHEIGAINYSRGIITIVDLQQLKELSCECYETLRDETPESPSTRSRL
jgi:cAMP-binding proteins - catabolite gene activator and regulatory subunit of cAMP-dependent protein kinases